MATYAPSPYQQAILDWLTSGTGNAIVEAVAGAGKTSTLVMLANAMPPRASAVFLAFNRSIADELKDRLPESVKSATFHSLAGNAVNRYCASKLRQKYMNWRTWVDAKKTERIYDAQNTDDDIIVRAPVLKLVALFKAHGWLPNHDETEVRDIMAHFDVANESESHTDTDLIRMARAVLTENNAILKTIDYDDMLYFVQVFNLTLDKYDYVMVDESQDTNPIQREILRRVMGKRSRLIAVGDPAQAIYGFRGASSDAMQLIQDEFSCVTLPLSITYRCPASVVQEAQRFVSHIQAAPNAKPGTVSTLDTFKLTAFEDTDLIVCRNTAPLVQLAYRCIAHRKTVRIMGRDIGKGLTFLIRKLSGKRGTLADLPDKLEVYREREVSKALKNRQDARAQSTDDKVDSILALLDSMTEDDAQKGIEGLCAIIESMFDDKRGRFTTLATVHKAKGMEAPRVFILEPALMPSKYAKQDWQRTQETNLQYVAVTRALDTLHYVEAKTITV